MSEEPKEKPKLKYVPHKTIHLGYTYLGLDGTDDVLKIALTINKVMRQLDKDDNVVKNVDGTTRYAVNNSVNITVLTKEEYLVDKQMGFE